MSDDARMLDLAAEFVLALRRPDMATAMRVDGLSAEGWRALTLCVAALAWELADDLCEAYGEPRADGHRTAVVHSARDWLADLADPLYLADSTDDDAPGALPNGWAICPVCRVRPYELGGDSTCDECGAAWRAEYAEHQVAQRVARREARAAAGKAICRAKARDGNPCASPPVRGTDLCSHHTVNQQVLLARDMGKAYGDMGLDYDTLRALIAPVEPKLRAVVAAYAFTEHPLPPDWA